MPAVRPPAACARPSARLPLLARTGQARCGRTCRAPTTWATPRSATEGWTDRRVQAGHAAGKQRGPPARLAGLQVANRLGAEARRVRYASLRRAGQLDPYGASPGTIPGGVTNIRLVLYSRSVCTIDLLLGESVAGLVPAAG